MVSPLQRQISHNRYEHAYRLDYVWNPLLTARARHRWAQHVVEPEDMHYVKLSEPRPAVPSNRWIPGHCTVAKPCWQIDALHPARFTCPPKGRTARADSFGLRFYAFL